MLWRIVVQMLLENWIFFTFYMLCSKAKLEAPKSAYGSNYLCWASIRKYRIASCVDSLVAEEGRTCCKTSEHFGVLECFLLLVNVVIVIFYMVENIFFACCMDFWRSTYPPMLSACLMVDLKKECQQLVQLVCHLVVEFVLEKATDSLCSAIASQRWYSLLTWCQNLQRKLAGPLLADTYVTLLKDQQCMVWTNTC